MADELANAYPTLTAGQPWALFGATGVTGRLVLERALARGHRPRLIGRDRTRLAALASGHGLEVIEAQLDDRQLDGEKGLIAALADQRLVLNVAGPFARTAAPLIAAALAAGVDYADCNGELPALEQLLAMDQAARAAGVALVGAAGFGVAASDGLALQVSQALGGADWLRVGVAADSAFSSPAVGESTLAILAGGGREIAGGALVSRRLARRRWRGAGAAAPAFASAPLAELAAVRHVTGVRDCVAGVPMPAAQAIPLSLIAPLLPWLLRLPPVRRAMAGAGGHAGAAGPGHTHTSRVWVEGGRGAQRATGLLEGGEGYALAADIAVRAVEAMLAGPVARGAHTPASAFGAGFVGTADGVRISITAAP